MRSLVPIVAIAALLGAQAAVAETSGTGSKQPMASSGSSVSDTTIQRAGKALKDVVAIRQRYSRQIQAGNGGDQQELIKRAQAESAQAVKAQGLSVSQYNNVIELARSDPNVKQRLLTAAGASQQ